MKVEENNELNQSYIGQRPDVLRLVSPEASFVLDVGCSTGTVGQSIKEKTGATVYGIEYSKEMANIASNKIDKVFIGDALEIIQGKELNPYKFDTIIFADVLEHLQDPWQVLNLSKKFLSKNGEIIVSLPNIRHISTINNLVFKGYWPYRDRGIHDRTHLRYFTKKNIIELFENANLDINVFNANYRILEKPHRINKLAKLFAFIGLKNFFAFQYLVKATLNKKQ